MQEETSITPTSISTNLFSLGIQKQKSISWEMADKTTKGSMDVWELGLVMQQVAWTLLLVASMAQ